MSAIEEGLFPEKLLLLLQGGVYLSALVAGHLLVIRPALRLQAERSKRTVGKKESAVRIGTDVDVRSAEYHAKMQAALEKARQVRTDHLLKANSESQQLVHDAQVTAYDRVKSTRSRVAEMLQQERALLPSLVADVAKQIGDRLGVSLGLVLVAGAALVTLPSDALASAGPISMESTFWPYFQFALFAAIVFWAGKKIIPSMLVARRNSLKEELDEARSLLSAAETRARELEAKLATAEREIKELLEQYDAEGRKQGALIVEDAKHLSDQLAQNAERIVREAIAKGREDLRRELLDLAISEVEKRIVGEKAIKVDGSLKLNALQGVDTMPR